MNDENDKQNDIEMMLAQRSKDLDELDLSVPSMDHFRKMVAVENRKAALGQKRQFFAFAAVAATLLAALLFVWGSFEVVFFLFQGIILSAGLIAIVFSFITRHRQRVRQ